MKKGVVPSITPFFMVSFMSYFMLSAAHKSSGKTTVSIGLCASFARLNKHIQAFKKGPDYIDPMWLAQASGRSCYNLDFYTMTQAEIKSCVVKHMQTSDIGLIEGNKGLYDGLNLDGSNSNAALAKLLEAPVVLVIDVRGMTRGIAPLILGYQAFEPNLNIIGVIFNQVGGSRHETKLQQVVEYYTDLEVLGGIYRHPDLEIIERHLGLIPSNESKQVTQKINQIADKVAQQVDLNKLEQVIDTDQTQTSQCKKSSLISDCNIIVPSNLTIGIMQDAVFGFYYADDLQTFAQFGVDLVPINALTTRDLPKIDGLFIGGGFPESCMLELDANIALRQAIYQAIEQGLPSYAECGGLMYLSKSLTWKQQTCQMVGVLPFDTIMHTKPQGRGYVKLKETRHHPWPKSKLDLNQQQTHKTHIIYAHEFHYSGLQNLPEGLTYAYQVERGYGINGKFDGIVYKNLLASYSHLRHVNANPWIERFIRFIKEK